MPPDSLPGSAPPHTPATDGLPLERWTPADAHSCPAPTADASGEDALSQSAREFCLAPLSGPTQRLPAVPPTCPPRAPPDPPTTRHQDTLQRPRWQPPAPAWSCRCLPSPQGHQSGTPQLERHLQALVLPSHQIG